MTDKETFNQHLADCLSRSLPGFDSLESVKRLSGGASQETYRLEITRNGSPERLAVRRAIGGSDADQAFPGPGLAVEAKLFQIAREAGVPEPEIHHVFEPDDQLGAGFVMEWLDGETVGGKILRAPELEGVRPQLAFECGEVLAKIHGIDPAANGLTESLRTVSTERFIREIWDIYRGFKTSMPMIDYTARWLLEHMPGEAEPRLVHNDFRNGNIMVSPNGIVAVLDWELAHLGDPVRDLGWICTNSWRFGRTEFEVGGFGKLEQLLDGYESVSGVRIAVESVHFWEVFGSFWWAAMSLLMASVWRNGPDRTVERPAIARRSSECQVDCANLIIPGPVELVEESRATTTVDMPRIDELIESVRDFLRDDARKALDGRNSFLALVASNSLDIASRELTLGPGHMSGERDRLRSLFSSNEPLDALRDRLCSDLRDGNIALDVPGLADHLRTTAANQLAIDQPGYSGLATALKGKAHG